MRIGNHLKHHDRFYAAMLLGMAAFVLAGGRHDIAPIAIGADVFFIAYLVPSFWLMAKLTPQQLKTRASIADEGRIIVVLIMLLAIIVASISIFAAINQQSRANPFILAVTLMGAPLGWLMLHTVSTFHYANLFYRQKGAKKPLEFPGEGEPGLWDFFYFSLVIGMTAQVSDVQVASTEMRRAVTGHAIVSFFFNTVLIAMAVNAAISGS